jgi:uncharacterized integral membrane protein
MSVLNRNGTAPAALAEPAEPAAAGPPPVTAPSRPPARTRASAAWLGVCLAAVVLVVLIVFMLQNTGSVQVSFLWMDGNAPLAIVLLIAGVGASLVTILVGATRITQLRRRIRRQR